jgi:prevent-host-death family protein
MLDTITARDANHRFSKLLKEVEGGKAYVVTRNGVPVAQIVPIQPVDGSRRLNGEQEMALAESLARLKKGWPLGIGRLDREELYGDAR